MAMLTTPGRPEQGSLSVAVRREQNPQRGAAVCPAGLCYSNECWAMEPDPYFDYLQAGFPPQPFRL